MESDLINKVIRNQLWSKLRRLRKLSETSYEANSGQTAHVQVSCMSIHCLIVGSAGMSVSVYYQERKLL